MAKDPFELVLEGIKSLKDDISDLYEKYNEMNRLVWIKLTELETNAKNQMAQQQVERAHWQWIVPVAISIIAIVVTLFEVIYRIK